MSSASDSQHDHYYTGLQYPAHLLAESLSGLRRAGPFRLLSVLLPLLSLAAGAALALLLLHGDAPQDGWLSTGGKDLRAFALEPEQVRLERFKRGPRFHLSSQSLLVKYQQDRADQQVQVHTPHVTVVARDAVFFTAVEGGQTVVGVQRGEVVLFTEDKQHIIAGPGEQLIARGDVPERAPTSHDQFKYLDLLFPRPGGTPHAGAASLPVSPTS